MQIQHHDTIERANYAKNDRKSLANIKTALRIIKTTPEFDQESYWGETKLYDFVFVNSPQAYKSRETLGALCTLVYAGFRGEEQIRRMNTLIGLIFNKTKNSEFQNRGKQAIVSYIEEICSSKSDKAAEIRLNLFRALDGGSFSLEAIDSTINSRGRAHQILLERV